MSELENPVVCGYNLIYFYRLLGDKVRSYLSAERFIGARRGIFVEAEHGRRVEAGSAFLAKR